MMNEKVAGLLNQQIQKELYSAYLYLDMANYYGDAGLAGFENWFYVQAKEEMDHAMLLRNYLLRNGVSVKLLQVDAPAGGGTRLCAQLALAAAAAAPVLPVPAPACAQPVSALRQATP